MSNSKKITDLAAYTDSQVQSNDLLFITDIAAQETKKITAIDIADYAFNAKSASIFNGNYTGSFTGSFSGSFTGNLTGTSSWATNALVADSVSGGTGEVNTASNTGSYGYGLVSNKVGVDLRFKQIGAGNNVNIDLDAGDANVVRISAISTLTSPGGATGNVQFNSFAGTFGGNSNLSWDTTNNNKLTVVGNVSSTTFSSSVTNVVGYFGTASFSVSSSNAISSSYSLSSSFVTSASFATTASYSLRQDLGINSHVSTNTINSYKGSKYTYLHLLGSTPKYFRCVLICTVNDTSSGYSQYIVGDEIDAVAGYDSSSDNEHTAITSWTNSTLLGASLLNNGYLVNNKDTGYFATLDPTKWKLKFYYA